MTQTKSAKTKTCSVCGQVKALDEFWIGRRKCKACYSEVTHQWLAANREEVNRRKRLLYESIREQEKERKHLWYVANREKIAEHHRRYEADNRDKVNERSRKYWANHKEQRREIMRRYEAANRESRNEHSRQYQKERYQKLKEEKATTMQQFPSRRFAFADLRSSRRVLRRSKSGRLPPWFASGRRNTKIRSNPVK